MFQNSAWHPLKQCLLFGWGKHPYMFHIHIVRLDKDLKPAAKDFGLRLLRNKDKQMHVKAIASYLIKNGLVEVTCTDLKSISREDVQLKKK